LIPRKSRGLEAKVLFFFGLIFFFAGKRLNLWKLTSHARKLQK
jgi:hypothetical protein